jgi:hypothetical protein
MKLPTDHIFRVIHSMSASEKRYFKRHYASDASLLTNLFDFINSQKAYDEEAVKTEFADSKLAQNLKVYKIQLSDLLLKSLVSYHSKNSVHSKIRIGLEEVDILMDKQLFDIALSKTKRVKAICLEYEAFEHLFPILSLELSLNSFYSANSADVDSNTFHELEASIASVQEILTLQKYSHSLSDIKNHLSTQTLSNDQHQFYKSLLEKLLLKLKDKTTSNSLREQYYQYHVVSMIYRLVFNDPEKEHQYKSEQIALLKSKESISQAYPSLYFASMHNYLSSCWKLRRIEELEKGIAELQLFINNNSVLEPNRLFVYYLQLLLLFGKGIKDIDESLEKEIMAHIKKNSQEEDYLSNLIYLRLAILHIYLDKHKKVQFYLRRIDTHNPEVNENFKALVFLLELVSHYQSNDLFLIQNTINAHSRKKNKITNESSALLDTLISFFQKLIKEHDPARVNSLAENLKSNMKNFTEAPLHGWLKEYLFFNWLDMLASKRIQKNQKQLLLDFINK